MTNIKISEKGKALLRKKASSARVAREIVRQGAQLSSGGSIAIDVDGKTLTLKGSTIATS